MARQDVGERRTPSAVYPSDLGPEIQRTLAALADVEARYAIDRERLDLWSGPSPVKARLMARLESRRWGARHPLVQRLADLQQEMTAVLLHGKQRVLH